MCLHNRMQLKPDIPKQFVQDSIPDCMNGADESEVLVTPIGCKDITMIPCFPGDVRCFPLYVVCHFEVGYILGIRYLKFCRNGQHLANCSSFVCAHHFKCPYSYCIPWGYRCDGKQDCPYGEDEEQCGTMTCAKLLRCKHSNICVHIADTCDEKFDCPEGEDELFCDLPICPNNCSCLHYALMKKMLC